MNKLSELAFNCIRRFWNVQSRDVLSLLSKLASIAVPSTNTILYTLHLGKKVSVLECWAMHSFVCIQTQELFFKKKNIFQPKTRGFYADVRFPEWIMSATSIKMPVLCTKSWVSSEKNKLVFCTKQALSNSHFCVKS